MYKDRKSIYSRLYALTLILVAADLNAQLFKIPSRPLTTYPQPLTSDELAEQRRTFESQNREHMERENNRRQSERLDNAVGKSLPPKEGGINIDEMDRSMRGSTTEALETDSGGFDILDPERDMSDNSIDQSMIPSITVTLEDLEESPTLHHLPQDPIEVFNGILSDAFLGLGVEGPAGPALKSLGLIPPTVLNSECIRDKSGTLLSGTFRCECVPPNRSTPYGYVISAGVSITNHKTVQRVVVIYDSSFKKEKFITQVSDHLGSGYKYVSDDMIDGSSMTIWSNDGDPECVLGLDDMVQKFSVVKTCRLK